MKAMKAKTGKEEKIKKAVEKSVEKEPESNHGAIKKVGVISTIIESIKNNPLTKAEILDILTAKFPDRKADGMKATITIQLGPGRLATRYILKKDGDKYVIEA